MPTYDMRCRKQGCGYTGEYSFSMNTPRENFPHCPNCNTTLDKDIQMFAIGGISPASLGHTHAYENVDFVNPETGERVPGKDVEITGTAPLINMMNRTITMIPLGDKRENIRKRNQNAVPAFAN